jgi:hypothetical protein
MTNAALHPTPRMAAVLREQFLATGVGLRRELMAVAALSLFVTAIVIIGVTTSGGSVSLSPDGAGFVLGWIGLLAPLAVWKAEGPSNRGYFWALPVDRTRHTLLKVLVGWLWLMITLAAFLAFVALQSWITGGGPGVDEMRYVLADGARAAGGAVEPTMLREIRWTTPGWQWVVPFLAPTVTYLIGSIAALSSDHGWRWLVAPFLVVGLLGAVSEAAQVTWLATAFEQLVAGRYGIETLLTGSNEATVRLVTTAGETVRAWTNLAEARQWFTALAIWLLPALAGVFVAARRYQER